MLALCRAIVAAAVLAAAAPAMAQQSPSISPDSDPACASPVPPPITPEMLAAYRVRQRARPPMPPATEAVPIRQGAMPKHACFLEVARRGQIDLLFVGDSITDFFGRADRGADTWKRYYGKRSAANFGISGDTTQDVLWRMRSGELEGFKARLIVLMLGTNNIGRNTNDDIVAGNAAILAEFRKRQPQAKVLILGIFPRGSDPAGAGRLAVREINTKLAALADGKSVFFMDIASSFLDADGTLIEGVMVDGLHPGAKGYVVWADAIEPAVARLMKR